MTRLLILVEGQSEEIFVKQTLTPYLAQFGVYLQPPIILWTKRLSAGGGHRGGTSHWEQIRKNLKPLLSDSDAWVTTLLDFYGLPEDVPGWQTALAQPDRRLAVADLQQEIAQQFQHPRFIPFLALHEFEAWLFAAPQVVAEHFGRSDVQQKLEQAIAEVGEPELINHGKTTHPKARLDALNVGYKETADGATIMQKIGIEAIRTTCPHFAAWLQTLQNLAQKTECA